MPSGPIGPDTNDVVDRFRSLEQLGVPHEGWQVFYVDRAAAAGGDGSQESPFETLAAGMMAAGSAPSVLVLAPGLYGLSAGPLHTGVRRGELRRRRTLHRWGLRARQL